MKSHLFKSSKWSRKSSPLPDRKENNRGQTKSVSADWTPNKTMACLPVALYSKSGRPIVKTFYFPSHWSVDQAKRAILFQEKAFFGGDNPANYIFTIDHKQRGRDILFVEFRQLKNILNEYDSPEDDLILDLLHDTTNTGIIGSRSISMQHLLAPETPPSNAGGSIVTIDPSALTYSASCTSLVDNSRPKAGLGRKSSDLVRRSEISNPNALMSGVQLRQANRKSMEIGHAVGISPRGNVAVSPPDKKTYPGAFVSPRDQHSLVATSPPPPSPYAAGSTTPRDHCSASPSIKVPELILSLINLERLNEETSERFQSVRKSYYSSTPTAPVAFDNEIVEVISLMDSEFARDIDEEEVNQGHNGKDEMIEIDSDDDSESNPEDNHNHNNGISDTKEPEEKESPEEEEKTRKIRELEEMLENEKNKRHQLQVKIVAIQETMNTAYSSIEALIFSDSPPPQDEIQDQMKGIIKKAISELKELMDPEERRRIQIKNEIVKSSKHFVTKILRVIVEEYRNPIVERGMISGDDVELIFSDIKNFYESQQYFLSRLQMLYNRGEDIGAALADRIAEMQNFSFFFLKKYKTAVQRMQDLKKSNSKFRKFMEEREYTSMSSGISLSALLFKPVEHFGNFRVLLERFLNSMGDDDSGFTTVSHVLDELSSLMMNLETQQKHEQNLISLARLEKSSVADVHSKIPLKKPPKVVHYLKPGRVFKKEGDLVFFDSERKKATFRYILCSDILVQTRMKGGRYRVVAIFSLHQAEVRSTIVAGEEYSFILETKRPDYHVLILCAKTLLDYESWMREINQSIKSLELRSDESLRESLTKYGVISSSLRW
eukprot:TRINITY_DN4897_c0_g1_i1.p1 TRINITY_DN4897_c0_g1~~TRINITY_DN4897_c0_g1_i1.p1  ORF type:complete len:832 (-),score=205.61 TRINITY_DN4897_c0_g1_i1:21-2516(-)